MCISERILLEKVKYTGITTRKEYKINEYTCNYSDK